jgi:hypothetical protein
MLSAATSVGKHVMRREEKARKTTKPPVAPEWNRKEYFR